MRGPWPIALRSEINGIALQTLAAGLKSEVPVCVESVGSDRLLCQQRPAAPSTQTDCYPNTLQNTRFAMLKTGGRFSGLA